MTLRCVRVLVVAFTAGASIIATELPAGAGTLKVGAARVDITPPATELPEPYLTIHDRIYARAIVLDNGTTRAALVSADVSGFPDATWADLSSRIAAELGCPVEQVLISGTHTHSSPPPGGRAGRPAGAPLDPNGTAHGARIGSGVLEAVRQAVARLQPARVGFGTGQFFANVNRDAIDPETRLWYQGPNLEGPSDKTVSVVTFESLSGRPIAVYVNYAMHAVFFFMRNQISADFPGATSRHIEQAFGDEVVAIWTSGAAGDQNPLSLRLSEPAVAAEKRAAIKAAGGPEDPTVWEVVDFRGASLSARVLDGNAAIVQAVGTLLGEEVIRVMGSIRETFDTVRLWGARTTVTCPGRQRTNTGREGAPGTYVDADPVSARVGVLMIGRVAIGNLGAEPYSMIGQRLRRASPFPDTMLVTIANGTSAGYIPTDDAYGKYTFQVLGSRFKPGCGETGVVNALLGMMRQYSAQVAGAVSLAGLDLGADKTDIERIRVPLDPGFSPSVLSYSTTVDATYTATAFITPSVAPGAAVRLRINDVDVTPGEPHKVSLSPGVNPFRIAVTPMGGRPEVVYQLTVTREDLSREYRSEVIGQGVWRIRDFGGTIGNQDMYLIEGRDRAILFDTGMGRGDLAGYVKSLTRLPIDVAITHGNRDHFLQVDQFPGSTVYMSGKDVTRLPPALVTRRYRWVRDGDRIDLGGRSFDVVEVPGHSLGSVVYSTLRTGLRSPATPSAPGAWSTSSRRRARPWISTWRRCESWRTGSRIWRA